jgi:hypothetical protein
MSIGLHVDLSGIRVTTQRDAVGTRIFARGFVNRRSGVQSPHPAPRKTAYFLHFPAVSPIGMGGIDGTGQRFIQPQKPEHSFRNRSLDRGTSTRRTADRRARPTSSRGRHGEVATHARHRMQHSNSGALPNGHVLCSGEAGVAHGPRETFPQNMRHQPRSPHGPDDGCRCHPATFPRAAAHVEKMNTEAA